MGNYLIRADIVDVSLDTPNKDDIFFVDTNVWLWLTYSKLPARNNNYEKYINKALAAGSTILYCGLSLAEIAHAIEKSEREIYESLKGKIKPKQYRHLKMERQKVVSEISAAWNQVKNLATHAPVNIDQDVIDSVYKMILNEQIDGYDSFILKCLQLHNVKNIITDDSDFAGIPDIQVFTSNPNTIQNAKRQNKSINRLSLVAVT